ncbi:MAG: serine hydrolase domain-containing protein [Janthinobacterium lividum]
MSLRLMALALPAMALLIGLTWSARADSTDDYLKAQMTAHYIPGLSVAVVQDGKVVKSAAYGLSDVAAKTPATVDTVYGLGSCSKPITAVAVMQLVEAGKISLDAPVSRYLDGLPTAWSGITVRQLLTHTSGLPNYRKFLKLDQLSSPRYKMPDAVVSLLTHVTLDFPPGTKYEYSNTNYHLLGQLIEKVSGQTYSAYLASYQFQPAGMTETRLSDAPTTAPNQATGYNWDGKTRLPNALIFPPNLDGGDSGLLSTAPDLAKWVNALSSALLLTPETLRQMMTPGTLTDGTPVNYGLGLVVSEWNGHPLVGHSGSVPGYSSSIFYFPDSHLAVILLCNLFDTDGTPLTDLMALEVAKQYLPAVPAEAAAPDTEPEVTRLLRRTLIDIASGKVSADTLTPEMHSVLTPETIAQANRSLAPLGAIGTISFLTRTDGNGLRLYRYRVFYGTTPVIVLIALTPGGKIAGLRPMPE